MSEQTKAGAHRWSPSLKSRLYGLARPADELFLRAAYAARFYHWSKANAAAPVFDSRYDLYQYVIDAHGLGGTIDFLEFGVFHGESLRWWAEHNADPASRFYGFDTFTGLPDAWVGLPPGTFTTGGKLPDFEDSRVALEVGLFQDTLGDFLSRHPLDRRTVIHLDADLYSSTLYVLTALGKRLKAGDVILFDELGSAYGVTHEFRALGDFESSYRFHYRLLAGTRRFLQAAIEVV
ncbi:TylF/MycF/NovP-related O-methyltransferase [Promineifilum sp.]|uniref:TylF/MycF/NovP-related O-methyltransferase n=1 Tax=Promineifilum sp. TaxID=2664178 RepID=UPI0035B28D6E